MLTGFFILLLSLLVVYIFFKLINGTVFDLNISKGKIWVILVFREYSLILMPLVLIQFFGVNSFPSALFFVKDDDTFRISLISLSALTLFSISLIFFAKLFPIPKAKLLFINYSRDVAVDNFARSAFLSGFGLLAYAVIFLNYKHALYHTLATGEYILAARLENVYSSGLPSQLAQLINVCSWIMSIYGGILIHNKKIKNAIVYLIASAILASAGGGKAPIVMVFIISILSYSSFGAKINLKKSFLKFIIYFIILFFSVFWIVSLQIQDLDLNSFLIYMVNRIGVGQMSGVFETFSIPPLSGDYFWHTIPFASLFLDYPVYDKSLMLYVEGADYARTGVKNSFFISEAFGIGSWGLVLVSPVIVAFSYALGVRFLFLFTKYLYGSSVAYVYALPIYILSSPLTGGFSSFALFKGLILNLILISVIWFIFTFFNKKIKF